MIEVSKNSPISETIEDQTPLSLNSLSMKQQNTLRSNLRLIEEEIVKKSQDLVPDTEINKLNIERRKIMEELSENGGLKGLYYKYRLSKTVEVFKKLTDNLFYNVFITIIIVLSCVILYFDIPERIVEKDQVVIIPNSEKVKNFVFSLNVFFGIFFVFEFLIQAIAQGLIIESNAYLKDPLNWIDLCVIIISIIGLFDFAENMLILRVFRLLRIIKLIKLSRELRIVTLAIWKTIPNLMTAIIPFMFYLLIVSVIGLSLYTGDGYTCNDPNPNISTKKECTGAFYSSDWDREMDRSMWGYFVGYDNFFDSLQTSFVLSNQEGWPDIMYYFMGYGSTNEIRQPGANIWVSVYYIMSVVVGSWIFLAVVTGIAYDSIKRNSDILKGINDLNSNQKRIHEFISLLITSKPSKQIPKLRSKWHRKIRDFFESPYYDKLVFIILILNIIVLLFEHDNQSRFQDILQEVAEYIFLVIYTIEIIFLFISYGFKYFFNDNWRNLCLIIVSLSLLNIVVKSDLVRSNIFVTIRLIRMFRLLKFARGIRALIQVVSTKYKELLNIFILMFIVIVMYAFLGCYYFGDINYKNTDILNEHLNFSTFTKSLLTVFIFTTGENWPIAMADCVGRTIRFCMKGKENCGNWFSPVYFISLQILVNWILLNSFVAIIVDSFVMLLQEHDEINRMELVKKSFSESWNKYDTERTGFLSFKNFIKMYDDMVIPDNFEWSSNKLKFFKTKPPISYLFKNLKVYYNYITYTDALFCITSFWVNDDLPLNVRNTLWEHNGWNKIIRKKLFIKGEKITFSEKSGGVPLKEISFGAVYGIFLLQRKYKRIKDDPNFHSENTKNTKNNGETSKESNNNKRSIKSAVMDEDELSSQQQQPIESGDNKGSNEEFFDALSNERFSRNNVNMYTKDYSNENDNNNNSNGNNDTNHNNNNKSMNVNINNSNVGDINNNDNNNNNSENNNSNHEHSITIKNNDSEI